MSASVFSAPWSTRLLGRLDGGGHPKNAKPTFAILDVGGISSLYDFTDNQWHNQLRHRRIVIRSSHGEIADDNI